MQLKELVGENPTSAKSSQNSRHFSVKRTLKGLRQNPASYLVRDATMRGKGDTYSGSVVSGNLKRTLNWMDEKALSMTTGDPILKDRKSAYSIIPIKREGNKPWC